MKARRMREIRRRLDSVPPSPWYVFIQHEDDHGCHYAMHNLDDDPILFVHPHGADKVTLDFIAYAKGDIEFLLAELERERYGSWWSRLWR